MILMIWLIPDRLASDNTVASIIKCYFMFKGVSIKLDYFVTGFCSCKTGIQYILYISSRKCRAQELSVYNIHEDLSTDAGGRTTPVAVVEPTPLPLKKWIREWHIGSCEKTINRGAPKSFYV